jgi:hypothetical protein
MSQQLGDYTPGALVTVRFPTINLATGSAIAPAGLALGMRKNGATTIITTGISLTVNEGGTTGLHYATVNTAADAAIFDFGSKFTLFGIAGTVNGNSVIGIPVAEFSVGQDSVVLDAGVPQSVASTSTEIRSLASFANGSLAKKLLRVLGSGTGYWVSAPILNNVGDILTHEALVPVPTGSFIYEIRDVSTGGGTSLPDLAARLDAIRADTQAILDDTGSTGVVVAPSAKTGYSLSATQTFTLNGTINGNLNGNVLGSTNSVVTNVTANDLVNKTGMSLSDAAMDALLDRTIAEPTAAPVWPMSMRKASQWLMALALHKQVVTANNNRLRNYADSTDIAAAGQTDDGTTYTKNRW